jgi:vacuolar protein sorting-associated protein 52
MAGRASNRGGGNKNKGIPSSTALSHSATATTSAMSNGGKATSSIGTPSSTRRPNSSVLDVKADATATGTTGGRSPITDTHDPTATLSEEQLSNDLAQFLENPSLKAALADGSLDLTSYSSTVEDELAELESQCIAAYRSKEQDIRQLQTELKECDGILLGLQEMLLGFQADLGGLSGDIRKLQETSKQLGIQLQNRKAAETGLRQFLQHVVLSPQLAHAICKGPVNAIFQASVKELIQIHHDTHEAAAQDWSCQQPPVMTVAGKEMQSHVQQLRLVAVSRIRDYFLLQMVSLRKPQTNIRIIQSHGLLQYADLYDFLVTASPDIAKEIFTVYTESMSKTIYALFRTYQAQLIQLDSTKYAATRQDVLAMEDAHMRDTITTKAKKRVDVFTLGNRAQHVLFNVDGPGNGSGSGGGNEDHMASAYNNNYNYSSNNNNNKAAVGDPSPPILAHVALSEKQSYPYERLFKSCIQHLVDAVTNEHVVCRLLFKRDAFTQLFPPTLGLLLEQLENYLFGCHDALCLLLMIKVTHQFRRLAKKRTIHTLDGFFDQVTKLFWPRLHTVMEAHLRSIRQATPEKLGGVELHAHYVSRRFAEFSCSILLILQSSTNGNNLKEDPNNNNNNKNNTMKKKGQVVRKPAPSRTPVKKQPSFDGASSTGSMSSPPTTASNSVAGPAPSSTTPAASTRSSAGDMLLQDLNELLAEFVALLDRFSEEHVQTKKRIVFMINNLDQIVCIFQERRVAGKELNRVLDLLRTQRELFVEEELLQGFSKMIAFVQQTEAHLSAAQKNLANLGPGAARPNLASLVTTDHVNLQVVESLVREFASNWRGDMDVINRNVLSYFSNFRNGMEILKQVLTQLLLYYTRFQDVLRKVVKSTGGSTPAFMKDLVPTTVILAEIKKYALAI